MPEAQLSLMEETVLIFKDRMRNMLKDALMREISMKMHLSWQKLQRSLEMTYSTIQVSDSLLHEISICHLLFATRISHLVCPVRDSKE